MAFRGVLIDLAGVVYDGDTALPGARDALARLRSSGRAIRFVTNTTRKTKPTIHADLLRIGIDVGLSELFTPVEAAANWLAAHGATPHLLVHPAIEGAFAKSAGAETAVVIGDAENRFTYGALNAAFRKLNGGAEFLALAKNRVFRDADGELSLDAGAVVTALEYATGREAVVLGKPSADFFAEVVADMGAELGAELGAEMGGLALADVAMIGDDAESDVAGALRAGIGAGLLVKTGKYRPGDEARFDPAPTTTVADIAAAVDWIVAFEG